MVRLIESWRRRSLISRLAHLVERVGLALAGGSSGLFVAAHVAMSDFNLINSGTLVVGVIIYGASGFYLGIDLPPAAEKLKGLPLRKLGSKADAVELLSAAGTFLTAVTAAIAVTSIILSEADRPRLAVSVLFTWIAGASMQIAAGVIARIRADRSAI